MKYVAVMLLFLLLVPAVRPVCGQQAGPLPTSSTSVSGSPHSTLDSVRRSINPTDNDYGAAMDRTLHRLVWSTVDSTYFWLFVICALSTVVLFVWVVLLEQQRMRRLALTKLIVRQSWVSMRVFAALWKETDTALRAGTIRNDREQPVATAVPLPSVLPTFRGDSTSRATPPMVEQIDRQQKDIVDLHRLIAVRDKELADCRSDAVPIAPAEADSLLRRQIVALQEIADELRAENTVLAAENAARRNGEGVSNAMAALSKRYESLRVSRNKLQVDVTALRVELVELSASTANNPSEVS